MRQFIITAGLLLMLVGENASAFGAGRFRGGRFGADRVVAGRLMSGVSADAPSSSQPLERSCLADSIAARDTSLLDSADLRIVLSSRKAVLYHLGARLSDGTAPAKEVTYLQGFAVEKKTVVRVGEVAKLLVGVMGSDPMTGDLPKCTLPLHYCIRFVAGKQSLSLFFSDPGQCGEVVKMVVLATGRGERSRYVREEIVKGLTIL